MTFSRIEGIINDNLPFSALRSEEWWNNNATTSQGYAWRSAGWKVQSVNLKDRTVSFKREFKEGQAPSNRRKRRRAKKTKKPFTPVPVKPRRLRRPSKTKIAKAVARARNIERRNQAKLYRGRLKPKSAYEKRLYKSETGPSAKD